MKLKNGETKKRAETKKSYERLTAINVGKSDTPKPNSRGFWLLTSAVGLYQHLKTSCGTTDCELAHQRLHPLYGHGVALSSRPAGATPLSSAQEAPLTLRLWARASNWWIPGSVCQCATCLYNAVILLIANCSLRKPQPRHGTSYGRGGRLESGSACGIPRTQRTHPTQCSLVTQPRRPFLRCHSF